MAKHLTFFTAFLCLACFTLSAHAQITKPVLIDDVGISPQGWHIATEEEMKRIAAGPRKKKEVHPVIIQIGEPVQLRRNVRLNRRYSNNRQIVIDKSSPVHTELKNIRSAKKRMVITPQQQNNSN